MIDSSNHFAVGMQGEMVVILRPYWRVACASRGTKARLTPFLSKKEALNLAAWIVSLSDPNQEYFKQLLEEIQK